MYSWEWYEFNQAVWEKENSAFNFVKLRLKIDLVSHPALVEGLGKCKNRSCCWLPRLVRKTLYEDVAYELFLISSAVSLMSCSSWMVYEMRNKWLHNCCFVDFSPCFFVIFKVGHPYSNSTQTQFLRNLVIFRQRYQISLWSITCQKQSMSSLCRC